MRANVWKERKVDSKFCVSAMKVVKSVALTPFPTLYVSHIFRPNDNK